MSRDYLSYGSHLDKGFPFVGWSLRLTGLERNKFIGKFFRTMSLDHATNGKETRAWQFDKFAGSKISFLDIETFHSNSKPQIRLKGKINKKYAFRASLSHEKNFAIAVVISEKTDKYQK